MKRTRCQYGAAILISLLVAVGAINLVPGNLVIESSSARAVLDAPMLCDVNETLVLTPPALEVYWGWKGNLSFIYWDVAMDIGIANATVLCQGWYPELNGIDCDNGTYIIEIDTTGSSARLNPYASVMLLIIFEKENYETQFVPYSMRISPVPTLVQIQVDEFNLSWGYLTFFELTVPIGNCIDLRFFYNDTDPSEGYVGGLLGAEATVTLYRPTLVRRVESLTDYGNCTYSFLFNTTENWLFEAVEGDPFPHELPYYSETRISLENRTAWEITIRIFIIEIPTVLVALNVEDVIFVDAGGIFTASLRYYDTWPGHEPIPISNASVFVECSPSNALWMLGFEADAQETGLYHVHILFNETGPYLDVFLTITFEKDNYETQSKTLSVQFYFPPPPPPGPINIIPTIIMIAVVSYCYRRNKHRIFPASTIPDDAVPPAQAPDSLDELGNPKGASLWYSIYFILVILIGIGWFIFLP